MGKSNVEALDVQRVAKLSRFLDPAHPLFEPQGLDGHAFCAHFVAAAPHYLLQAKRQALIRDLADPAHDDYLDDAEQREAALEEVDYYLSDNVFWVPEEARWGYIRDRAKQPNLGRVIDDALLAIENENAPLKGMDFNLGKEAANTLLNDQHPDLKFDYVLSNPPYNIKDWGAAQVQVDKRWTYGGPSDGNANFAWMQHILWHLKPSGQAGVVMANGSMSSTSNNEGAIRQAMVEADTVEVMVALPNNLFFNTAIPACLWFLCKDKRKHGRDRRGEVLFIDARKLGRMESRTLRVFDDADIQKIARAVHLWRDDGEVETPEGQEPEAYEDVPGFCRSVKLDEIAANG